MTINIDDTAKKHAKELMDKLADKRAAHMSDLVEAFRRAIMDAMPKNPWGYGVAGLATIATGSVVTSDSTAARRLEYQITHMTDGYATITVDGAMLDPCSGKWFDLARDVEGAAIQAEAKRRADEDDGA